MRPYSYRFVLSALAVVGSLDIGFSFANAKPSTVSPNKPLSGVAFISTSSAASSSKRTIMSTTTRQRKNAASATTSTALGVSGGAAADSNGKDKEVSYKKLSVFLTSLWGSGGVIYILAKAIKRVVPIALEPFKEGAVPLSQVQLG
mgnify:CR=1 FL=1